MDRLRPIPQCADLVAARVTGNVRSFERVNDSVQNSRLGACPEPFGRAGKRRIMGMRFRCFETLPECGAAIAATRETTTVLRSALRARPGFTCAPKSSGTNARAERTPALREFDGDGYSVAAAEAEGCDAALQIAALQFVQQCDQDAGAGCADGMAQGYRAAVYVYFRGV